MIDKKNILMVCYIIIHYLIHIICVSCFISFKDHLYLFTSYKFIFSKSFSLSLKDVLDSMTSVVISMESCCITISERQSECLYVCECVVSSYNSNLLPSLSRSNLTRKTVAYLCFPYQSQSTSKLMKH